MSIMWGKVGKRVCEASIVLRFCGEPRRTSSTAASRPRRAAGSGPMGSIFSKADDGKKKKDDDGYMEPQQRARPAPETSRKFAPSFPSRAAPRNDPPS